MAEHCGEDSHGDQCGESCSEDEDSVVFHGHQGCDEESLVANFRDENHSEGEDERMEGLDETFNPLGVHVGLAAFGGLCEIQVVLVGRVGDWMW